MRHPNKIGSMASLSAQLTGFLSRDHVWHSKGRLTADMVWKRTAGKEYGKRYLPDTVSRALRLLEESSRVAVKPDGKSVAYKWLPPEYRKKYIPITQRPAGAEHILFYP